MCTGTQTRKLCVLLLQRYYFTTQRDMTSVFSGSEDESMKTFVEECGMQRDINIHVDLLPPFKVSIDRFNTLAEIREMVRMGQQSGDSNYDYWPSWRLLIFVLDNKYDLTRWEEERTVVWYLMDEGYKVYVREDEEVHDSTHCEGNSNNM